MQKWVAVISGAWSLGRGIPALSLHAKELVCSPGTARRVLVGATRNWYFPNIYRELSVSRFSWGQQKMLP